MGGGFAGDAHLGADPRSSGVAPQPPLAVAAPCTDRGLAGLLARAVLSFRCAGVLVPVASGAPTRAAIRTQLPHPHLGCAVLDELGQGGISCLGCNR